MTASSAPTVVLVHGAFADASGWAGVIRELQSAGITVQAPPNPLRSVAGDAATVGAAVAAIHGPVLRVGHSYGGAVITQAAAGLDNVIGLVYLAAFGLDLDESVGSVQEPFAPPLLAKNARPTAYDAVGAAGGPDLYIDTATFRETFCADLPADCPPSSPRRSGRSPPRRSAKSALRSAGRRSRPPTWSPRRTRPSTRTRNVSWPSAWAAPWRPSRPPTLPSSAGRSR